MHQPKIQVNISGEEKNKSEIVYNNVIDQMEDMKMTKAEQVQYLKTKVAALEVETRNKLTMWALIAIGFALMCLGLFFMYIDYDVLGIITLLYTFAGVIYRLIMVFKSNMNIAKDDNYDKIEQLRRMLSGYIK